MAKVMVCDMCGGSGYRTSILTCCLCKRNSEHIYCRLGMSTVVPEFWYCDDCLGGADTNWNIQALDSGAFVPFGGSISLGRMSGYSFFYCSCCISLSYYTLFHYLSDMKPSTQCARDGSTKKRINEFKSCTMNSNMDELHELAICRSPFKQLRSVDTQCNTDGLLHTNGSNYKVEKESISRKEFFATYPKEFDSISGYNLGYAPGEVLKRSQGKYDSDHPSSVNSEAYSDFQVQELKFQGMPCQNISCGSQDTNANSYSGTSCWRVILDASDEKFAVCCEVDVYYPSILSTKAWEYSRKMPTILKLKIMPRFSLWPKIFRADPPTISDIGLLFFPSTVERPADGYGHLVDYVESQDVALKCSVEDAELLIYPSKWLRFGPDMRYLWGAFRCVRERNLVRKEPIKNQNPAKLN